MLIGLVASVLASAITLSTTTGAGLTQAGFEVPGNRLVNPDAEQGTQPSGWEADGFGVLGYGQDRRVPARDYAERRRLGARLFAAGREGATLRQVVSLADLAQGIDSGQQELYFGAQLGGTGERPGSVRLSLQLLSQDGAQLGDPYTTGAPTATDREHQTGMITCLGRIRALPAGARAARLTLTAVGPNDGAGSGLADRLYITTHPVATPTVGRPAEAESCIKPPPGGVAPPPTAPRESIGLWQVVAKPARLRDCSRPLRFAIRPAWVGRVARLTIIARGRTRSLSPTPRRRSIRLQRSRRVLLVKIRVRLFDGAVLRKRVGYKGCRVRIPSRRGSNGG